MLDLRVATFVVAQAVAWSVAAAEPPSDALDQRKIEAMEREQRRMHRDLREKLEATEDSPRKEELKKLLAEIERRMNEQAPGKVYLSPNSNFTPEMRQYHGRFTRKIEDCGTRHLPKRDGKTVYGKGLAAVTIDKAGKVLEVEILESSRDKLVDGHMQRVVRSSSPFGPMPERLTTERTRPFQSAMILTRFEFVRDGNPPEPLPENEGCKWK